MNHIKRYVLYVLGILVLALGTVLYTKAGLGTSALTSLPYTISQISDSTLGQAVMGLYLVFVFIELLIYRSFKKEVILQLALAIVVGLVFGRRLYGIGIGTLIAGLSVGLLIQKFKEKLKEFPIFSFGQK